MEENTFDIGDVFVPTKFFSRVVYKYYHSKLKARFRGYPEKIELREHKMYVMLCFIWHMIHTKKCTTLASGTLPIAWQLCRKLGGADFNREWEEILAIDKEQKFGVFSGRRGIRGTNRMNSYGIDFSSYRAFFYRVERDSDLYKELQSHCATFQSFLIEKSSVEPSTLEYAQNYYKYAVDMEKASEICRERHGVTFEMIPLYFSNLDEVKIYDPEFVRYRQADKEMRLCKDFNSGNFIVTEVYGRLYSPFHSLPKKYRSAFYERSTHAPIVEVVDMKGAFVKGSLITTACMSKELGNTEAERQATEAVKNMDDPYAFAVTDDVDRSYVKSHVLSFFFAPPAIRAQREKSFEKLTEKHNPSDIRAYADKFLSYINNRSYLNHLSDKELNKELKDFTDCACVLGCDSAVVKFTNHKKKAGCINFKSFTFLVKRALDAVMNNHIVSAFIKKFGKVVYDAFSTTCKIFQNSTDNNINEELKYNRAICKGSLYKSHWKKDLRSGNVINTSIVCQEAEGLAMFHKVLPDLKNATGCTKLVSLHDAIWSPEAIARFIDAKAVSKELDRAVWAGVWYNFKNNSLIIDAINFYKCQMRRFAYEG